MPEALFAYGSLQLPEVFEAVTLNKPEGTPAVLKHFQRTKLKGFGFPAILPVLGEETSGVFYPRLGADVWRRLDAFEDDFYERKAVAVQLADGSWGQASTYVLSETYRHLSRDEAWSLDDLDFQTIQDLLARL